MSSEKFSIEIDSAFIEKFFELGEIKVPENVELNDLNKALDRIKSKLDIAASLKELKPNSTGITGNNIIAETKENALPKGPKSVLVVDDLGIVTVQMETLFRKLGFKVTTSREFNDAIKKFKTQDFGYAVLDLFIPTEREGFILIDEIKKLSLFCKLDTKIIVMSASNKKEHIEKCINKGANLFIEKSQGWQEKIIDFCIK
ncbi:MAG TPA: response regulator [Candidatus Gastranaerophilales bacterium]|nr:response regulator [Candidatus Gastranaerophilales bacterium]